MSMVMKRKMLHSAYGIVLIAVGLVAILGLGCMSDPDDTLTPELGERVLYIDSELVDCVGLGPRKCLRVRESLDEDWTFIYESIVGFDYREGTSYQVRVNVTEVENPPQDASSIRYMLLEIIDIDSGPSASDLGERVLYIDSELVDCVGVGPQKCLRVRESLDEEWTYFYESIVGFDYQEGTSYQVRVDATEVEDPPQDASSIKYTLLEIISSDSGS